MTAPPGAKLIVEAETMAVASPLIVAHRRRHVNGVAKTFVIRALPARTGDCPQFLIVKDSQPAPDSVAFQMDRCPRSNEDFARVFDINEVEVRPERLRGPMPNPEYLLRSRNNGRVMLQFVIDTTGRPEPQSLQIVDASDPGFIPSASNAVLRSVFSPARLMGRKVRTEVKMPIEYRIAGGFEPDPRHRP